MCLIIYHNIFKDILIWNVLTENKEQSKFKICIALSPAY